MSKVHIALVGGQSMPVYLGIKYCNPEKVVFIFSKESERQKQTIKAELDKNIIVLKSEPLDPVQMDEIEVAVLAYKEKFVNDEVSLNISGGTKAWSYFFAKAFENVPNAKVIYVDQNNEVYDLKEKTHEKVQFEFMTQFKLNKNPLMHFTDFSKYAPEDIAAIKKIEEIRESNIKAFTDLTNLDRESEGQLKNQTHGEFKVNDSSIKWDKKGKCIISIKNKGEIISNEISSPKITQIIFNAAWFELKVAHIISQWSKAKQIFMNCKFLADVNEPRLAEKFPKNEIDIIVDTGDKALFIECKTNIYNATDIDKFYTAVRNYGGSGSKALFVCLNKFTDNARNKISDCGNMWSWSFAESNGLNSFYAMLDRRIEGINK